MKADCIKWIKLKQLLTSCSFITSRADTDALLTPRVIINKVHISPQFEYIISKRFSVSKTLFHSVHHLPNKQAYFS